jgi:plasmid stabilization system protein ParE
MWLLAKYPHLGRRRDSDLRPGLRSFAIGDLVLLHRLEGEDLLVLHVVRGGRDLEQLLSSESSSRLFPKSIAPIARLRI